MEPWWPRRERLEWELQALSDGGYEYERVSGDLDAVEGLHVRVNYPKGQESDHLDVYFPALYPYFRFQIDAPHLALDHHQDPLHHNLCLLGRPTDRWSLKFSLRQFLDHQVPKVLEAGTNRETDEVLELEDAQAEPVTDYYSYEAESVLVIDGSWRIPEGHDEGRLVLGFEGEPNRPFRAFVLDVLDRDGGTLGLAAVPEIRARCTRTREGAWLRVDEAPPEDDAGAAWDWFRKGNDPRRQAPTQRLGDQQFELTVGIIPEEHSHRDGSTGDGWLAVIRARPVGLRARGRRRAVAPWKSAFLRCARGGPSDYRARVPEAAFLAESKVCVIGLGCIGAAIAHELCQVGVGHVHLVDKDHVDPASTVRWPLGVPAYGRTKAAVLMGFLSHNYPYSTVTASLVPIGMVDRRTSSDEWNALVEILKDQDLIIDATAEHGVQGFLSAMARHLDIPYVWVHGTPGGWGGLVGDVRSRGLACWGCIETAVGGDFAAPAAAVEEGIQPAGCGDPTFTAAGFDMHTLSAAAARAAVAILSGGDKGYPDRPYNVEVIEFRTSDGKTLAPTWKVYSVERKPGCGVCGDA